MNKLTGCWHSTDAWQCPTCRSLCGWGVEECVGGWHDDDVGDTSHAPVRRPPEEERRWQAVRDQNRVRRDRVGLAMFAGDHVPPEEALARWNALSPEVRYRWIERAIDLIRALPEAPE